MNSKFGVTGVAVALLLSNPAWALIPEGDSLSPWIVLDASPPEDPVNVALGKYASFHQSAVPAEVITVDETALVDGVTIKAGTPLAVAVGIRGRGKAWCFMPPGSTAWEDDGPPALLPGQPVKKFRTPWGGSTRCLADADDDGYLDTQLNGKFDVLGLPSIRRLTNPVSLAHNVKFTPANPNTVFGFFVSATIIYADISKSRSSRCHSYLPTDMKAPRTDVKKRRYAIILVRNDGTACFDMQDEKIVPEQDGELPTVGTTLANRGAEITVEKIDQNGMSVRVTQMFRRYVIASRTEREIPD